MFYCLWKAHVEQIPHKLFSFHGMFSLCAVQTYVENILWKPGLSRKTSSPINRTDVLSVN